MATKAHKISWPEKMLRMLGGALEPVTEENLKTVHKACRSLQLDEDVFQGLYSVYLQIASWITILVNNDDRTKLVGINGAQGTGKSTAAFILKNILETCYKRRVCVVSMDDIYHTRNERAVLARDVHPLLVTRGVPGTHDIELGLNIISCLINADSNSRVKIPCFDKAVDERRPEDQWPVFAGKPDIIILEGWCVSAIPQPQETLVQPVNELERLHDHDCDSCWFTYFRHTQS